VLIYDLANLRSARLAVSIDHEMDSRPVKGLIYNQNFLLAAVDGIGVFKWLLTGDS